MILVLFMILLCGRYIYILPVSWRNFFLFKSLFCPMKLQNQIRVTWHIMHHLSSEYDDFLYANTFPRYNIHSVVTFPSSWGLLTSDNELSVVIPSSSRVLAAAYYIDFILIAASVGMNSIYKTVLCVTTVLKIMCGLVFAFVACFVNG